MYSIYWFFGNKNNMSDKNNDAAPNVQEYRFNNINDCVKYLNEDETINKELNKYLRNQLRSNKYNVARCDNDFRYFKPYLICKFVNKNQIMKLEFDRKKNPCEEFNEVILDFETVYKVIQDCCEKKSQAFIDNATSILDFINKKDKNKKISCLHCVDFIGRFLNFYTWRLLSIDFVKKILTITDVDSEKVDKSKNTYCIEDAIRALPDECSSMSGLLNLIFRVQDFSLFSKEPSALYQAIYALIIKSEKYIKGDQVGAIRDVLENGELYKKFREELKKVKINFDMQMLIEGSDDLTMLLFANNLAVSANNGKITIEKQEPSLDDLIHLLEQRAYYLNDWIENITNTKTKNEHAKQNQFKIDSFEKLKNVKVKLIKSYIEHSSKSEILKKVFKPLLELEESEPEQFNKLLNEIKLSDRTIKSVFQAIKLKDKLTGEQFDAFKKAIGDLCFGVDKPLFSDMDLLSKFGSKTLTSKQMEELLNLSEPSQNKQIVSMTRDAFLPVFVSRLKDTEVLSEKLLAYFYNTDKYSYQTVASTKNSVVNFCRLIYYAIVHSSEYIKEGNSKKAIETVLSSGKEYDPFRKYMNYLVTNEIKYDSGRAKINLDDIYKKENHTVKKEGQEPKDTIVKKLVDLLDKNHFKITFDNKKGELKLESTLQQIQKDEGKAEENKEKEKEKEEKELEGNKVKEKVKIDEENKENKQQKQPNIENKESTQTDSKASKKIRDINNINQQDYKSQNINLINTESPTKTKTEISIQTDLNLPKFNSVLESNDVGSLEMIINVKKEKAKTTEKNRFKNIKISKSDSVNFSAVQKIDGDAEPNNISKVLTVAAVALFILGLLVLSNIILPVVPVKESISAGIAISSFLLSGGSELVSRWLSLKSQSKNIESITKNPNSDMTEENVYQVDKNITKQEMPISKVKNGQISNDQRFG